MSTQTQGLPAHLRPRPTPTRRKMRGRRCRQSVMQQRAPVRRLSGGVTFVAMTAPSDDEPDEPALYEANKEGTDRHDLSPLCFSR